MKIEPPSEAGPDIAWMPPRRRPDGAGIIYAVVSVVALAGLMYVAHKLGYTLRLDLHISN